MAEKNLVRKNINFPVNLLDRVSELTQKLNIDFSHFVREATEEYVNNFERAQLQKELEEGYKAKAKADLRVNEEFKYVDGENL
jgi:metal-responsive CopG/Arc/MetJ family transcriptional regulator